MKRRSRRPPNRLGSHIAPLPLFVAGAIGILGFLFQSDLLVRVIQVLVFSVLVVLSGKRVKWGYFLIMVGSVTFFNLLTPVGEVLFSVGRLAITRGALEQGLLKGFAIVGMVFLSLFSVRPDLKLPGTFGGLLGRVFFYFEQIFEGRRSVSAAHLVESIDGILEGLFPGARAPETDLEQPRTDAVGYLVLGTVSLGNAILAILF